MFSPIHISPMFIAPEGSTHPNYHDFLYITIWSKFCVIMGYIHVTIAMLGQVMPDVDTHFMENNGELKRFKRRGTADSPRKRKQSSEISFGPSRDNAVVNHLGKGHINHNAGLLIFNWVIGKHKGIGKNMILRRKPHRLRCGNTYLAQYSKYLHYNESSTLVG